MIRAVRWLLDHHGSELESADDIILSLSPKYGHDDDFWIRLRAGSLGVVGEVHIASGLNKDCNEITATERQGIIAKLYSPDARHKYVFVVGSDLAKAFQDRAEAGVDIVDLLTGEDHRSNAAAEPALDQPPAEEYRWNVPSIDGHVVLTPDISHEEIAEEMFGSR